MYYVNRTIQRMSWYVRGKPHRIDGPAVTTYYDNGSLKQEKWFFNGEIHSIKWSSYYRISR